MTPLTAEQVAELYWKCLETQRSHCPWEVFKRVPAELQRIAPLERKIVHRSPEKGVQLVCAIRLYSEEKADGMCRALQYNVLHELACGYNQAKDNFIKAVVLYYRDTLSFNYYRN